MAQTNEVQTVKDFEGKLHNIKDYQRSLNEWPSYARKVMADDGSTHLVGICLFTHKCGCTIEGCGTLQFPVRINFCDKHKD
jgi:hypothetical protein